MLRVPGQALHTADRRMARSWVHIQIFALSAEKLNYCTLFFPWDVITVVVIIACGFHSIHVAIDGGLRLVVAVSSLGLCKLACMRLYA